jgi:hypothetical protein
MKLALTCAALFGVTCVAVAAQNTPAAQDAAHGKRSASIAGFSGQAWSNDFGVRQGRCNNTAPAQPGVIADALNPSVGRIIGAKLKRAIEGRDRACMGASLEMAKDGQEVIWVNGDAKFTLVPVAATAGTGCRQFTMSLNDGVAVPAMGCAKGNGTWEVSEAPAAAEPAAPAKKNPSGK